MKVVKGDCQGGDRGVGGRDANDTRPKNMQFFDFI